MKRLIALFLLLTICLTFIGCKDDCYGTEKIVESPLKLLYETKDQNGNIISQTFYNETSEEYWVKDFTYTYLNNSLWACTSQRTTVVANMPHPNANVNSALNVYYNCDLENGPITIMDNEHVKISIVKYLAADNWWEFGYELRVVNKTNQVITVIIDAASIMDINCKPLFSVDHIDAKNTAYFTLAWDKETLEICHIPYIDNIEFMVKIFDNDNWTAPALTGERVLIKKG